jgi:hypothetical protein
MSIYSCATSTEAKMHSKNYRAYPRRAQRISGGEGVDFVRCRICGKHLCVISGRHLSTHGTDRETYIEKYGLSPDQLCSKSFRVNHSSRRDYRPHGKRDWIAAIRKIHKRHGHVFAGYLKDNRPHLYNQGVWLFGDWDEALRAAGFAPEQMRMWSFWDQAKLISQIQRLRKQHSPLYAKYVLNNHKKLFSAARRQFGSWRKALIAAGIEIPKYAYGSRVGILRALTDTVHGYPKKDVPQSLKSSAVYYFGSWQKATVAATRERTGSPKYRVTRTLSRMHRRKQPLVYGEARRDNLPLVRAAEKQFGSWGKALYAAGIDPNLYYVRHKWREPRVTHKRSSRLWQPT